jgi:integrase
MGQPRQKRSLATDGTVSVRGKNANGEGSVYRAKVTRNGVEKVRWEAVRSLPDGRRIKRTGATQAEARARLDQALAELDLASSRRLGPNPTFATLIDYHLDNIAASRSIAATTRDTYRKMADAVVAIAGAWSVRELQKPDAQQLVNELGAYSEHFARGCRRVARQALNEAIDLGYLSSNPLDRVRLPMPKDRKQRRTLTVDQQRSLVAEAIRFQPPKDGKAPAPLYRHGLAVALLFTAGLRVSEVLGLRWEDIDYDAETLSIRRGVVYQDNVGPVVHPTKTRSTEGQRHLPAFLHGPLRKLRAFQLEEQLALGPYLDRSGDGFVFIGTRHQLANRQAVTKELHRICKAIGIETTGLGTHSGRRTVITNLYVDGAVTEDIAAAVGHSDPTTTRGYVQSLGDRPTATARRMAELLQADAES